MPGKILWIDDTPGQVQELAETLRDEGYAVELVSSASEGASLLAEAPGQFLAVIVDLLMDIENFTVHGDHGPELLDTMHGLHAGLVFGRWVKRHWPDMNVIGISVKADMHDEQIKWFKEAADGYFDKYSLYTSIRPLLLRLKILVEEKGHPLILKTFVIHGQDEDSRDKLVKYLRTNLRIPDPIVFRDQSLSLPELLEEPAGETRDFKLVFGILTTTDTHAEPSSDNKAKRHSRENVIFELGCLYGKSLESRGKVILLHSGEIELSTDIPGLTYIDISAGIEASDQLIRREVAIYLPLLRKV